MKRLRQSFGALGLCVFAASTGNAFAQSKSDFMEGYPFQYEGQIGGLDAWSLPEQEDLWLVLPDGQTVIAGFVFNGRGNDIGSALLGIEPMSAKESLDMIFAPDPEEVDGGSKALDEATLRSDVEDASDPEALVAAMIADLDASKTPEEFQTVLQSYATLLQGVDPVSEKNDVSPSTVVGPSVAPAGQPLTVSTGKPENPDQFLSMIQSESFWFSIGAEGADPVYMFYDPACPHCARAIRNLEPRIEDEEIQLRLIPVPVINEASLNLVAGILTASDPEAVVIDNARQLAGQGKTSITPGDAEALRPEFLQGIQSNMDLAGRLELPGVPFFAWGGASGPKFLSGVPAMDYDFGIRLP